MSLISKIVQGAAELLRSYYEYEAERELFMQQAKDAITEALRKKEQGSVHNERSEEEAATCTIPPEPFKKNGERRPIQSEIEIPPHVLIEGPSAVRNWLIAYAQSLDDGEPVFILRGRDMLAPDMVREWAYHARRIGVNEPKLDDARRIADQMEQWQWDNDIRKVAD